MLMVSCTPKLTEKNVKQIVSRMTLEEKAHYVVGTNPGGCTPPDAPPQAFRGESRDYKSQVYPTQSRIPGAAGDGYAVPRLGVKSMTYSDGPSGLRINPLRDDAPGQEFYCTAFPTGTLMASTWNAPMVKELGAAIGQEVREYGVDILLGPGLNIQRNPLCGRNFEYYSEDPLLTGRTAAAYIQGVQSQGVGACPKHFAANSQEKFRNGINSVISMRALREIYLKGFEIAVRESDPWTLMTSYNKVNGVFASENKWLLTDVLRGEWGFNGFVMTDWWAMELPVEQVRAGNDLLMPGYPEEITEIENAVKNGTLPEEDLDRNVAHILSVAARTISNSGYKFSNKPDLESHAALAREVAREGIVLLKNQAVLPLEAGKKVALLGVASYDTQPGGSGSGYVYRKYKVTIADGLEKAGYILDAGLKEAYNQHIVKVKSQLPAETSWAVPTVPEMSPSKDVIKGLATQADVAVISLGRMAGEGGDRTYSEGDFLLTKEEKQLLELTAAAFHAKGKKVVVVLNIGSSIEMDGWQDSADALLMAWMPGQEGGNAVADILSGAVSPSGKLPITLARRYDDIPASRNFGVSPGEINAVNYEEDLRVGYRYFADASVKPAYPFGFGLSYTSFEYSGLSVKALDGKVELKLTVKNTGSASGKEAVQIYVNKPEATPDRPSIELCAYAKTALLAPGASEEITLEIPASDLSQYVPSDDKLECVPGEYTFWAAASSDKLNLSQKIQL